MQVGGVQGRRKVSRVSRVAEVQGKAMCGRRVGEGIWFGSIGQRTTTRAGFHDLSGTVHSQEGSMPYLPGAEAGDSMVKPCDEIRGIDGGQRHDRRRARRGS